ncbi:MAG TPA: hypothetical protein VJI46_07275 [Candidatus Nanoarchaeia archaeon]|nr:hypothetical protein [Candidatus Nanoarchaeia archaeon]
MLELHYSEASKKSDLKHRVVVSAPVLPGIEDYCLNELKGAYRKNEIPFGTFTIGIGEIRGSSLEIMVGGSDDANQIVGAAYVISELYNFSRRNLDVEQVRSQLEKFKEEIGPGLPNPFDEMVEYEKLRVQKKGIQDKKADGRYKKVPFSIFYGTLELNDGSSVNDFAFLEFKTPEGKFLLTGPYQLSGHGEMKTESVAHAPLFFARENSHASR